MEKWARISKRLFFTFEGIFTGILVLSLLVSMAYIPDLGGIAKVGKFLAHTFGSFFSLSLSTPLISRFAPVVAGMSFMSYSVCFLLYSLFRWRAVRIDRNALVIKNDSLQEQVNNMQNNLQMEVQANVRERELEQQANTLRQENMELQKKTNIFASQL